MRILSLLLLAPACRAATAASFPPYPPTRGSCSMQEKLQMLAPVPFGVVIIEKPGDTLATVAARMAQAAGEGFTALKQILLEVPLAESEASYLNRTKAWFSAALDAGLSPWWYGEGGWECFTVELLRELGLPEDAPPWQLAAAPAMRAYQAALQRDRVRNMTSLPVYNLGEPGAGNPVLAPALVPAFAEWLAGAYGGNLTGLLLAWADGSRGNFSQAECSDFGACAALLAAPVNGWPSPDYRRYRDSMRFQADGLLARLNASIAAFRAADANAPVRTGGASLQLNHAYYAWDLFAQGALAAEAGSFYISSHLPWHYSGMQHEVDRPVFFEVSAAVAAGRGAWPGEWESSGGPSQYSGGQATAIGPGGITRLLLTYLAAGMRGVGLWTYNPRSKNQEVGEYALTTLAGEPSPRSAAAGAVARAAQAARWELWAAAAQAAPVVAVFYGWENEAVAARIGLQAPPFECAFEDADCRFFTGREMGAPLRARLGWARALLDAHIPFTHVDEAGLRGGALGALGVRCLVLPHVLALPPDLLPLIHAWQLAGGRVVADMPWLLLDAPGGTLHDQAASAAAAIFGGASVLEFASVEAPLDGQAMALALGGGGGGGALQLAVRRGQYARLGLAPGGAARVAQAFLPPFEDVPALVEARGVGAGSGALVNFEAGARAAAPQGLAVAPAPGAPLADVPATLALSAWMAGVATAGGALAPAWRAAPLGVPVHLRTAAFNGTTAHHVFCFYDDLVAPHLCGPGGGLDCSGGGLPVTLSLPWRTAAAADAVTGEALAWSGGDNGTELVVRVPFRSARWLRLVQG